MRPTTVSACAFLILIHVLAGLGVTQPSDRNGEGLPVAKIEEIIGLKATMEKEEVKLSVPQTDLLVVVDGFPIIPPMGATSWVVFTPTREGVGDHARIMGDIVLLEGEFTPVQRLLRTRGFRITAIHNHFVRDEPKLMFTHITASGDPLELARTVKALFDGVSALRRQKNLITQARSVESNFDPAVIERMLGRSGAMNDGVYKVVVGRPDVPLKVNGVPVTRFAGFNTWMAFQGSAEHAAAAGDFVMRAEEVDNVIDALIANGFEIAALHNHMVQEEPRVFFLHFWGVGPVKNLAQGLRAALDREMRQSP